MSFASRHDYHIDVSGSRSGPGNWIPSEALRDRLLVGMLAAMGVLALSAAGLAAELGLAAAPEGLSTTDVLALATIAPETFVLWAFLGIARETKSLLLWRSSLAFYLLGWLFTIGFVLAEVTLPDRWPILAVCSGVGLIAAVSAVVYRPDWCRLPRSDRISERTVKRQAGPARAHRRAADAGSAGPSWLVVLGILMVIKFLIRFQQAGPGFDWAGSFAFLLMCGAALLIWLALALPAMCFGVAKISLRRQLGFVAVLSGAMDFVLSAGLLVCLMGIVWLVSSQRGAPDAVTGRAMTIGVAAVGLAYDAVIGGLFFAVRGKDGMDASLVACESKGALDGHQRPDANHSCHGSPEIR